MSDRTDERVTTIRFALGVDDIEPREYEDACDALASLAADAAETASLREETQTLREELEALSTLAPLGHHEMADFVMLPRRRWRLNVRRAWRYRAERDAAVADRDRLAKALDLIGHGWDGDEFNDPADLVEEYASIARAALAGREGSDDA